MSSRRQFIKQVSVLSLLTMPLHFSAKEQRFNKSDDRRRLAEAGPMLPPVPAILLTVNGLKSTDPTEISVVWTFVVNGNPPQIGISVGDEHVAGRMIQKHKEFVLNVPTANMVEQFDRVDMNSGKVADKFKLSGLTKIEAQSVNTPAIAESPIHVECKVSHELRVEPERTVFIANVLATTVLPGVCDKKGRLNVDDVDFFGMTAGSGEFYTMGKKVGYIGKSIGRTDIKY